MKKLTIFDDGEWVATITSISKDNVLIFARSSREWREMKRLVDATNKKNKKFLEQIAKYAHDYNYSTELTNQ